MEKDPKLTLHQNAKGFLFRKAIQLREASTAAELALWAKLRNREFLGLKFRQQHPIGNYIADFYCHSLKLVIEVDGSYHFTDQQQERDAYRDQILVENSLHVLGFRNEEVLEDMPAVLAKIEEFVG